MSSTIGRHGTSHADGLQVSRLEPFLNTCWVVGGAGLCVYAWKLGAWGPNGPDSGFFPLLAGALVLVCGLALLLHRGLAPAEGRFWAAEPGAARRAILLMLGVALLIALVRYAGFVTASILMMPVLLRLVEKRSWWYAAAVGIVATTAVYLVFVRMLGMLMPRGPLGF